MVIPQNHEILPRHPDRTASGFLVWMTVLFLCCDNAPAPSSVGTGDQRTHAWQDDRKQPALDTSGPVPLYHPRPVIQKEAAFWPTEGSPIAGERSLPPAVLLRPVRGLGYLKTLPTGHDVGCPYQHSEIPGFRVGMTLIKFLCPSNTSLLTPIRSLRILLLVIM